MAQPGEARAAPAHARVATIQKWIVGIAAGCWVAAITAALGLEFQPDTSLLLSDGIIAGVVYLLFGFGWLAYFAGQGLLLYLRPRDVQGRLRSAAQRTGVPRLYGLVLIWSGICLVLAFWLFDFYFSQLPDRDYSAVFATMVGLLAAAMLPLLILEAGGLWQQFIRHRARE